MHQVGGDRDGGGEERENLIQFFIDPGDSKAPDRLSTNAFIVLSRWKQNGDIKSCVKTLLALLPASVPCESPLTT